MHDGRGEGGALCLELDVWAGCGDRDLFDNYRRFVPLLLQRHCLAPKLQNFNSFLLTLGKALVWTDKAIFD